MIVNRWDSLQNVYNTVSGPRTANCDQEFNSKLVRYMEFQSNDAEIITLIAVAYIRFRIAADPPGMDTNVFLVDFRSFNVFYCNKMKLPGITVTFLSILCVDTR